MIPFRYRLRPSAHLRDVGERVQVWSDTPLSALWVNRACARLLSECDGSVSVHELAQRYSVAEERVFELCEHFRRRAILELTPIVSNSLFGPLVSVIVPVYERHGDLDDCLRGLDRQTYPPRLTEVLVVDDGSPDPPEHVCAKHRCTLIMSSPNRGQSFCRNLGASRAKGDILAFVDSDCVPEPDWLAEIIPYFEWESIGAAGGSVEGFYQESMLDRYEDVFSSLNLGANTLMAADNATTFYVPTCNLLVRAAVYATLGGIREDLRVGEDVDFCWRLRSEGHVLLYVNRGQVRHKHRNELGHMLRRKAQYGSSEAVLQRLHPDKRKTFPSPGLSWATWLLLTAGLVGSSGPLVAAAAVPLTWDVMRLHLHARDAGLPLPPYSLLFSVARTHMSGGYIIASHMTRYYMLGLCLVGLVFPRAAFLALWCLAWSSLVDYMARRPHLSFFTFLLLFACDNAAYQLGVFVGCARQRTFRSYIPVFRNPRPAVAQAASPDGRTGISQDSRRCLDRVRALLQPRRKGGGSGPMDPKMSQAWKWARQ